MYPNQDLSRLPGEQNFQTETPFQQVLHDLIDTARTLNTELRQLTNLQTQDNPTGELDFGNIWSHHRGPRIIGDGDAGTDHRPGYGWGPHTRVIGDGDPPTTALELTTINPVLSWLQSTLLRDFDPSIFEPEPPISRPPIWQDHCHMPVHRPDPIEPIDPIINLRHLLGDNVGF